MAASSIDDHVVNAGRFVLFGRLFFARAEDEHRCIKVRTADSCVHELEMPEEWVSRVGLLLGRDVLVRARRLCPETGPERAVMCSIRRAEPGEMGAEQPGQTIAQLAAEQSYDRDCPPDITTAVQALLPTRADAERFDRELEALRGRRLA